MCLTDARVYRLENVNIEFKFNTGTVIGHCSVFNTFHVF